MASRTDSPQPPASSPSSGERHSSSVVRLSDLHKECLRWVAQGLQSKEIAQKVGRSHRTVDTYISTTLPLFQTSDRRIAARRFLAQEAAEMAVEQTSDEGAYPPSELSQRLLSQPEIVADPHIFADDSRRATGLVQAFRRLVHLPPLGGKSNDLTPAGKFLSGTQIGLIGSMTVMAIVAIVQGIISLLT